ncbi:MAG TPA: lytic murein transglycosylase B, partial [Pseudomonadales bacterium]|nr:lytic murein transglycosylase B [Pseudomonadales bacterium]
MHILSGKIAIVLLLCASVLARASGNTDLPSETLRAQFIQTQADKGFAEQDTLHFLALAKHNQTVLDAISAPWEAKPWHQYAPLFLTQARLTAGISFWKTHQKAINRAAETFDVDPQIIVAIIGIETFFGRQTGKYSVLDALYTLGFNYPPRAKYFLQELAKLQQLVKEEQLQLTELTGSYAGAMGYGQFMPSSYLNFAVDFDKDGKRDLFASPTDAIGSVANYFHQHGWQKGEPVALPLSLLTPKANTAQVWTGEALHYTIADILSPDLALTTAKDIDVSQKALLLQLQQTETVEYWLGMNNFYV